MVLPFSYQHPITILGRIGCCNFNKMVYVVRCCECFGELALGSRCSGDSRRAILCLTQSGTCLSTFHSGLQCGPVSSRRDSFPFRPPPIVISRKPGADELFSCLLSSLPIGALVQRLTDRLCPLALQVPITGPSVDRSREATSSSLSGALRSRTVCAKAGPERRMEALPLQLPSSQRDQAETGT